MDFFPTYLFWIILTAIFATIYRFTRTQQNTGKVVAIVATRNEREDILAECLASIQANGVEYILVDDASEVPVPNAHIRFEVNKGKKLAQLEAVKKAPRSDYIVAVDSDTVLEPDAIQNALKRFDDRTGAVVGEISVCNDGIVNALYLSSFNIGRAIASIFGQVSVCSGAFTVYRRELFEQIIRESATRKINGGEDRYLTYLLLRDGWKTKYEHSAKSSTITPVEGKFIKQQIRWHRSFWRGLFYSWRAYKNNLFLFVQNIYQAIGRILTIALFILFWITMFTGNWDWSIGIILTVIIHSFLKSIIVAIATKRPIVPFLLPLWGLCSLFIIAPLNVWAVVTIKQDSWGNR